jgi:4-hydroxy-tetrahydrodipicolinate reductase
MTKILLTGCNGRMGRVITDLCKEDPDIEIAAGIDVAGQPDGTYPVYGSFPEVAEAADVIVDFSSPKVFDPMMDYALEHGIPVVVCTTGLSQEQIQRLVNIYVGPGESLADIPGRML